MSRYIFLGVFVLGWTAAYFGLIRPWLKSYRYTAGVYLKLELFERSTWSRIVLHFQGIKAAILAFVGSAIAALKSTTDAAVSTVNGLQPADLDPLKDQGLWHAFLSDGTVLKILSGLGIATALLAIKGHLTAARAVPQPDPTVKG